MRLGWAAKCATLNGNEQMNCLVIVPTELFIDLNGLFASKVIAIHSSGFIICFRLSLCLSLSQFTWHCIASGRLVVYVICWPAASTQCAPFLFFLMAQQLRPKINWIAKTFNTFRCKQEICQKSDEYFLFGWFRFKSLVSLWISFPLAWVLGTFVWQDSTLYSGGNPFGIWAF